MEILSALLFLLIISSGSVFALSFFNKKYEEIVPITCTSIVFISFIFGMLGLLKISTLIICIISIVLYILSFIKIYKDKSFKEFIRHLFTPGFVLYIILCFAFLFAIYGKLFDSWDEFSHWGDVVKAMTTIDDFATNHYSRSIFKTYPPGMSLFQYVLEKLNTYLTGNTFSEWQCYFSYYILAVSYLAPLTKDFSFKKPLVMFTYLVAIFCVPFTFYYGVYYQLYIDPFLSFLICAGGTELLLKKENEICFDLRIFSISFMLVLAKDTGLVFALLLIAAYVLSACVKKEINIKKICLSIISIALPKILWNYSIRINGATDNFGNKIDLSNLLQVILGKDETYRTYVLKNYIEAFRLQGIKIGTIGIPISYLVVTLVSLAMIILVIVLLNKEAFVEKNNINTSFTFIISSLVIFVLGLCIIYMYKFSEYEAKTLASYERYMNIVYLGTWLFITMTILIYLNEKNGKISSIIMICILCLIAPLFNIVAPYCLRATVRASKQIREPYNEIIDKSISNIPSNSKVWIIVQESTGFERLVYKFAIRPIYAANNYWSIGEKFNEDDQWTLEIDCKDWMNRLISEEYDYVAIYTINDYFIEHFSNAFETEDIIENNCVYYINKTNKKLEKIK